MPSPDPAGVLEVHGRTKFPTRHDQSPPVGLIPSPADGRGPVSAIPMPAHTAARMTFRRPARTLELQLVRSPQTAGRPHHEAAVLAQLLVIMGLQLAKEALIRMLRAG